MAWGVIFTMLLPVVAWAQVPDEVPDHIREEQSAEASWMIPTGKPGRTTWLAIIATRAAERAESSDVTSGFVIEGKCRKGKNFTICMGSGPWVEMKEGFEMAPDLSSAHVEIRHNKKLYEAHIDAGTEPLGIYSASESCFYFDEDGDTEEEDSGEGAGVYRTGSPSGSFAGRELSPDTGRAYGFMISGAMVTGCDAWWPRYWVNDDGTAGAVWKFPNAR